MTKFIMSIRMAVLLCIAAFALSGKAEVLTLSGETKSLTDELQTTGVTFTGEQSTIVAPIDASAEPSALPTSEFSGIRGVTVLSPDGTAPGTIDVSGFGIGGGRIETGLTDLVFDTTNTLVSGEMADGVTPKTFLPVESSTSTATGKAITYWKKRTLADIKSIRGRITYGVSLREHLARTCFFTNNGTTATAQFQSRMSYESKSNYQLRHWLMCIKVEFKQVGEDITARTVYAKATSSGTDQWRTGECFNFDNAKEVGSKTTEGNAVKLYDGNLSTSGYGIRGLVAGEANTNGGKGITVATQEPTQVYTGELAQTNNTVAFTYWRNLHLDDIEGMSAQVWAASAWGKANGWFMDRIDENTLRVCFQRYAGDYFETIGGSSTKVGNDYVVSATVELKQVGNDVTAQYITSGYQHLHTEYIQKTTCSGLPIDPNRINIFSKYNVRNLCAYRKPKLDLRGPIDVAGGVKLTGGGTLKISSPASGWSKISGAGSVQYASEPRSNPSMTNTYYSQVANTYTGRTIFDGGFHKVVTQKAFADGSTIILTNNATLFANVNSKSISEASEYIVHKGSRLIGVGGWNFNNSNSIFLFGGTYQVEIQQHYMGPLTLSDGAVVNGSAQFRFGCKPAYPWIYSLGSTALTNKITCGIRLYRTINSKGEFGTIFTMADLSLGGNISYGDKGYEGALVKKRGPAKLILNATCASTTTARVEVVEGTLRNESTSAFVAANSVELHDGVAYEVAGVTQSFGSLVVDKKFWWAEKKGATVKFEPKGTLAVSKLEIADAALLILDGDVNEHSFRVGTSQCLSCDVLSRIRMRVGDRLRRVSQNQDGYLYVRGLVLIFK